MAIALISGAEGFTGRYLAEELALRGHTVAGIGLKPRPQNVLLDIYEQVDLLDADATAAAISRIHPDIIFHLAGISHVQSSPALIYEVNIISSRNLLAALAKLWKHLQNSQCLLVLRIFMEMLEEQSMNQHLQIHAMTTLSANWQWSIWLKFGKTAFL